MAARRIQQEELENGGNGARPLSRALQYNQFSTKGASNSFDSEYVTSNHGSGHAWRQDENVTGSGQFYSTNA